MSRTANTVSTVVVEVDDRTGPDRIPVGPVRPGTMGRTLRALGFAPVISRVSVFWCYPVLLFLFSSFPRVDTTLSEDSTSDRQPKVS